MPIDLNEHLRQKNKGIQNNPDNKKQDNNNQWRRDNGGGGGNNPPPRQKMPQFSMPSGKKMGVIYALIVLVILLFLFKPFAIINSGEVGVKATAGKYNPEPLYPGIHFYIPGIQNVLIVDTKVRKAEFASAERTTGEIRDIGSLRNSAINVLDSRGLPVLIELTVQYQLNEKRVPLTLAELGQNWEGRIIVPVIREIVRNVVGSFSAEEIPAKRDSIAQEITNRFRKNIEELKDVPVFFQSLQLTEIVLPQEVQAQILKVQVARQETERVGLEVEKAQKEAQRQITLAKGTADANVIEAEGQAKANRLLAESLNQNLLSLRQIEVQGKFNEALQTNKDAKIFLTPGGATPNIWIDSKDAQRSTSATQR